MQAKTSFSKPSNWVLSWVSMFILVVTSSCITPKTPAPSLSEEQKKQNEQLYWLHNMIVDHKFSHEEAAQVLKVPAESIPALLKDLEESKISTPKMEGKIKILPYPGGRHPRIGFLDGAIDPHRDTKISIFTPWDPESYVVVDLPEALKYFKDGKKQLFYLAHTHIPTIWDQQGIKLEHIEWKRNKDGSLESHRKLPNGIEFGAKAKPGNMDVQLELWLKNGTQEELKEISSQVCVLLKGAKGFNAQTNDNKTIEGAKVTTTSESTNQFISTEWERARVWNNPPCPCMHSDPSFPDLKPGESYTVKGKLWFFQIP